MNGGALDHARDWISNDSTNSVVVVSGYGVRIHVERGHLLVEGGVGRQRERRRFNRATARLERLVVIGHSGFVTLEALRWLREVGTAFLQLGPDGELVALSAAAASDRAPLRRAQALAAYNGAAIAASRHLLRKKLDGQAALLEALPDGQGASSELDRAIAAISEATTLEQLLSAEARGALAYWTAWTDVELRFAKRDAELVPAHWLRFGSRRSVLTASQRLAINPANAILNYLYAVLEAESSLASQTLGLDPGLGFFHEDRRGRDSLALDLMEAGRPIIDAFALHILQTRTFRRSDFVETRRGNCRILPGLARELAATAATWRAAIAPVVEDVARLVAQTAGTDPPATHLTETKRQYAWDGRRTKPRSGGRLPPPRVAPRCERCGNPLRRRGPRFCETCRRTEFLEVGNRGRAAAAATLEQLRSEGRDPRHGGAAARHRGQKNAEHQRRNAAWQPDPGVPYTRDEFRHRILPLLRDQPIVELVAATGLSDHYCSLIRLGKRVPHPRHWDALSRLAD